METVVKYKVSIICTKNNISLVEWNNGTLQRGYIPNGLIIDDYVDGKDLELAIPYGVNLEEIITLTVTVKQLDYELKKLGIWTYEDILLNSDRVLAALKSVYGLQLSKLQALAKRKLKEL